MTGPDRREKRQFARFRAVLALATLAMVVLSWPLWAGGDEFPRVPFVAGWPEPSGRLAGALAAILLGALGLVALGRGGRWDWLTSVVAATWLILGDQGRLQPWMQQYLSISLAALFARHDLTLTFGRWYVIILYAASGLSKLDAAFVDELGGAFLDTLGHLLGLEPLGWSPPARMAAILAMPLGEVAVAFALATPGLRGWGLAGSAMQHLATIAVLGPWGLNHSAIVLAWNGAFLLENCILFGPNAGPAPPSPAAGRAAAVAVIVLVMAERWGWVDSWPAHALYASHAERSAVLWPGSDADALPPEVRLRLGPADADGYRRLDLTAWSRARRGVPVYPQNRVACGIAEALATRHPPVSGLPVRLLLWDRAGLGRRPRRGFVECIGPAAIRRRGDRFWINAHPADGHGG